MLPTSLLLNALNLNHGEIVLSEKWGAAASDYRLQLRQELQGHLSLLLEPGLREREPWASQLAALTDLTCIPNLKQFTISVSHCHTVGGYAIARTAKSGEYQLGFDIEESDRVTTAIIQRMAARPDELSQSPNPAALWAAKEATFKSLLGSAQPQVLSQIDVTNWQAVSPEVYTFKAKTSESTAPCVFGAICQKNRIIMGLSQFLPQLWSRSTR